MPQHTFKLNGRRVTVNTEDSVRMLWVIRDLLNVRGPKYGCGINVCKACTSHIKRPGEGGPPRAFNPCSVPVSKIQPDDEITTIEGLPAEAGSNDLHPMQEAWIEHDVPQCGYCQPGQIMAAVDLANNTGGNVTEADLDTVRNVCRCGTYHRIRQATKDGAKRMKEQGLV